jgi:hypothetical protein
MCRPKLQQNFMIARFYKMDECLLNKSVVNVLDCNALKKFILIAV